MAVKIADTIAPLGDFPGMMAEHLVLERTDGSEKSVQDMYNDGELGGQPSKDYTKLSNKPQVNGVELDGDKSISDLDLLSDDEKNSLELGSDGKLFTPQLEISEEEDNIIEQKDDGLYAKVDLEGLGFATDTEVNDMLKRVFG